MNENTHYHFLVWAATDKAGENFSGVTNVDVIAGSMKEAVAKAKQICPERRHYWVSTILEHHNNHTKED